MARVFFPHTPSPSLPPSLSPAFQVPNCEKLIELGGLKALFPLYMGRGWGSALKGKRQGEKEALIEQVYASVPSSVLDLTNPSFHPPS